MTISQERLREVLDYDPGTGVFTWKIRRAQCVHVGAVAGGMDRGYIRIKVDGVSHQAHRLAWLYVHGVWPSDDLDHVDEDKSNNRFDNLREATMPQNKQNHSKPHKDNKSGHLGVSFDRKSRKWRAQIHIQGKQQYLGYFATPEQASEAYVTAKREIHPFWVG